MALPFEKRLNIKNYLLTYYYLFFKPGEFYSLFEGKRYWRSLFYLVPNVFISLVLGIYLITRTVWEMVEVAPPGADTPMIPMAFAIIFSGYLILFMIAFYLVFPMIASFISKTLFKNKRELNYLWGLILLSYLSVLLIAEVFLMHLNIGAFLSTLLVVSVVPLYFLVNITIGWKNIYKISFIKSFGAALLLLFLSALFAIGLARLLFWVIGLPLIFVLSLIFLSS